MGFLDSLMQNIHNKQRSDRATDVIKAEEARTDKSGQIPQLVEQVARRLFSQGDVPPWAINGGDKKVRFAGDTFARPAYYIAAESPDWYVFLTLKEDKTGMLVNKPNFYAEEVQELKKEHIDKLSYKQQNAVVLGLQKILDIKDAEFKTLPRDRQSWQIKFD